MKSIQAVATTLVLLVTLSSSALAGNIGCPRTEASLAGNIGGTRSESLTASLSTAIKGNIGATLALVLSGTTIP